MKKYRFLKTLVSVLLGICIFLHLSIHSFSQAKISGKIDPLLSGIYNSLYANIKARVNSSDTSLIETPLPFEKLSSAIALSWTNGEAMVGAFIKVDGSLDELKSLGVKVHSRVGNIITADIPLVKLPEIIALPNMLRIEAARPVELSLNVAGPRIKAPNARTSFGLKAKE